MTAQTPTGRARKRRERTTDAQATLEERATDAQVDGGTTPRTTEEQREAPPAAIDEAIFGRIPKGADTWVIQRNDGGTWTRLKYAAPARGVAIQEWPLVELSLDSVRKRWGRGEYKIIWMGYREGQRTSLGPGKVFELLPLEGEEVSPRTPPPQPPVYQQGGTIDPLTGAKFLVEMAHAMAAPQIEAIREQSRAGREQDRAFYEAMTRLSRREQRETTDPELKAVLEKISARLEEEEEEPQGQTPTIVVDKGVFAMLLERLPELGKFATDVIDKIQTRGSVTVRSSGE